MTKEGSAATLEKLECKESWSSSFQVARRLIINMPVFSNRLVIDACLILLMSVTVSAMNSTATACPTYCSILGPQLEGHWAWIPYTDLSDVLFTGVTATATLVTIVDSARNFTTTSIEFPGNYTPATNLAGTRTQVVSYVNDGDFDSGWITATV